MKRIIIILIALIFIGNINAQVKELKNKRDKHIVSFRFGYSIPVSTGKIGSPQIEVGNNFSDIIQNGNDLVSTEKNNYNSRGAGLNFSLSYEYMITSNISVGMDFSYLHTFKSLDAYSSIKKTNDDLVYYASQESETSMLRATPLIGIYANENLLIRPYVKFGLLIPLAGRTKASLIIEDNTSTSFDNLMPLIDQSVYDEISETLNPFPILFPISIPIPTKTQIEANSYGSFSIGFDARIGAQYKLADYLNLFVELNFQMLSVKTKETKITKFHSTVTNEDLVSIAESRGIQTVFTVDDIPEILKNTHYLDILSSENNSSFDNAIIDALLDKSDANYKGLRDKASEKLNFKDNYNAFGFIIGIKYAF